MPLVLFLASLALFALSALAFSNNVVQLVRWWQAFLAVGGDSAGLAAHVPGYIPWLDWSAVDYSAVTTLIPTIGFFCMTVSSGRMLAGRRLRAADFPFFRGSDQFNVALGLFGTLWGIIVIGYFKLDTVTMADLMQCLHTALYSTLMAVVWVFLFDRPLVRPLFARVLAKCGLEEMEDGDLAGAVERLVVRLGEASDAFDARQKAYEEAFERRAKAYAEHFEKRLADYERDFAARQKEYVEVFQRRISELERRAESSERKLAAVTAALRD